MDSETQSPSEAADLVITRTFAAPRDRVWAAWTDPTLLGRWWGPKGFDVKVVSFDLRPGGLFHYSMDLPNGQTLWGRFLYRDIVAPQKLVFVNGFADADGRTVRNPWSADWPLQTLNVLSLAERDGRTDVTLRGAPLDAAPHEIACFAAGRASMQAGFGGTFDQLDALLADG